MKEIKVGEKTLLLVEVPSMAFGFDVNNYGNSSEFMYMLDIEEITEEPNHDETLITKPLPPGSWLLLGKGDEIELSKAKDLVGWFELAGQLGYRDYRSEHLSYGYNDAIDSFLSLLRSHNYEPKNTVILIKQ